MSLDWLRDANTQWVLGGCTLLGVSSGVLGSFAMLRRRSLMGDALAHAALPGVGMAFLLTGTRSLPVLLLGALIAGLLGAFCIHVITRHSRIKEDSALALVLSVFFGFGIVLLTLIQRTSETGNQAGLDKFIFGQAASMVGSDVRTMAVCAAVVCLAAVALFKELKLLCFDPGFAGGIGFSTALLDGVLLLLIVLSVVIGLQAVGALLMAALLITPAAAARWWTDRLDGMVWLAALIGGLSGAIGVIGSRLGSLPTGPLIVLAATLLFVLSLVFAPRKGLLARALRLVGLRSRVARENALRALYERAERQHDSHATVSTHELTQNGHGHSGVLVTGLRRLEREGLVARNGDAYALTDAGLEEAYRVVRNHRLWEMFLMHEGQLGADHVDRDADFIEHHLSHDIVAELERLLRMHGLEQQVPPCVHPVRA